MVKHYFLVCRIYSGVSRFFWECGHSHWHYWECAECTPKGYPWAPDAFSRELGQCWRHGLFKFHQVSLFLSLFLYFFICFFISPDPTQNALSIDFFPMQLISWLTDKLHRLFHTAYTFTIASHMCNTWTLDYCHQCVQYAMHCTIGGLLPILPLA